MAMRLFVAFAAIAAVTGLNVTTNRRRKPTPEASIQGLCNQYDGYVTLKNFENLARNNDCGADGHSSCTSATPGWIPWANGAQDLQNQHRMVVRPSGADHDVCIYHVTTDEGGRKPGIYAAKDCQYDKGVFLKAVPGLWMVVLSKSGIVSLWAPTAERLCPVEPTGCTATNASGQWQYRYTIPGAVTETWKHGTSKTHTESTTQSWSKSVSVTVSVGFSFAGFDVSTAITNELSRTFSQTYSDEWTRNDEHDFQVTWSEKDIGMASWQFIVNEMDSCLHHEDTLLREFAVTPNRMVEPCCLPGYAMDAPFYTKCVSAHAMLKKSGCSATQGALVLNV